MGRKRAVLGEAERSKILAAQKRQHPVHVTRPPVVGRETESSGWVTQ